MSGHAAHVSPSPLSSSGALATEDACRRAPPSAEPAKRKGVLPGYSAVLVRTELKEKLRHFRRENGFAQQPHAERCLMSAAVSILLDRTDLRELWLQTMAEASATDLMMLSKNRTTAHEASPG